MFGIDVIVLLSYDQVQFRDEGLLSLTYWTVVGAYTIPGEKNDTPGAPSEPKKSGRLVPPGDFPTWGRHLACQAEAGKMPAPRPETAPEPPPRSASTEPESESRKKVTKSYGPNGRARSPSAPIAFSIHICDVHRATAIGGFKFFSF